MTTPAQQVHELSRRLIALLEQGEPTGSEAIALRGELAVATARDGQLEDAFFQADELLKDAQRERGPEHADVDAARAVLDEVERIAREALGASEATPS